MRYLTKNDDHTAPGYMHEIKFVCVSILPSNFSFFSR